MKSVKTKLISAAALVILLIAALAGCAKTGTGNDPAESDAGGFCGKTLRQCRRSSV